MKKHPFDPSIQDSIFLIRGHKVMLDRSLAELYGVLPGALNRAVKRNLERFPSDFMFRLTAKEWKSLKCQIGISNERGGDRRLPYAFTEHGVAMLSSVLNSKRAIKVNIAIMRAFTKLREMIAAHRDLARRFDALEKKYDDRFKAVFDAIRELMEPAEKHKSKIGFGK